MLTKMFDKIYHNISLWTEGPDCIRKNTWPLFREVEFEETVENPDNDVSKGSTVKSTIPKLELCGVLFGLEPIEKLLFLSGDKLKFAFVHLWANA